ncbi:Hsc70 cochaperone (SGT) [Ceratobasidium theobromae]|uniref:Hsc70 cochaperone (SGT) n=1 Tax=Ceratobasidium theobromae TaxID=1582974 RepID=A0A5N5QMT9_9AGAM|nr:Hsc70 cochaperone (SGT) [Ceratobasidium theobromae]
MSDKKQKLVLSIIDFLETSISDGSIKSDDKEGIEIAIQCIGEAFGVDPSNSEQRDKLSVKPATLQSIFDVYLKTKDKVGAQAAGSSPAPAAAPPAGPSAADKAKAEKHKQDGNNFMASKDYQKAIDAYTEAIAIDPNNPIYYSNRAAAWSSMGDHAVAADDAEMAIAVDPKFVKAYSRLGHAHFTLGNYQDAKSAFERGLAIEPNNANLEAGLTNAETRLAAASGAPATTSSTGADRGAGAGGPGGMDWSQMANLMGGMGGGAGGSGGGMPDLASMLNNPQLMAMAQQMMANGGMDRLMSNPAVRDMADRAQSGGGMPSMADIMANPALRDLASSFMGGAGRGAGGPGAGNA